MVRVYLELEKGQWKRVEHQTNFWLDEPLYERLRNLKKIQGKGWDGVILIDGKERSGKSKHAMGCGWFLSNGTLTKNNFARGLTDAARKIADIPEGSVLIVDEGSLVFSSKESTTKAQKALMQILDVVGQKNLIFIICLPCFFDLNKTIAVRRSLFLLHVYPDKDYNRGKFAYWGEKTKKKLYIHGKKNFDSYAFPKAESIGEFMDFEPPFYPEYLSEIKKDSLKEVLNKANAPAKPDHNAIKARMLMMNVAGRLRDIEGYSQERTGIILSCSQREVSDLLREFDAFQKIKLENSLAIPNPLEN